MFFVLIAGLTNAFEFQNLAEVQELAKNSYASNLIQTISLKLQTNGHLDDITTLIDELLKDLDNDENKLDTDYDTTIKDLNAKISTRKEEIQTNLLLIADQQAIIDEYGPKLEEAKQNLIQYNAQVLENNAQIDENKLNREKDIDAFNVSDADHEKLCGINGACDLVIAELEKLRGSVQDTAALNAHAATTHQINSEINSNNAVINGIQLGSLLQLATKVDQNKLEELINKVKSIKQSCLASWQDDKDKESESKSTFEDIQKKLEDDNLVLTGNIQTQTANRDEYQRKVDDANTEIKRLNELIETIKKIIEDLLKEIEQTTETYNKQKGILSEDRDAVNKVKTIFENKVKNMSEFLKNRVGA